MMLKDKNTTYKGSSRVQKRSALIVDDLLAHDDVQTWFSSKSVRDINPYCLSLGWCSYGRFFLFFCLPLDVKSAFQHSRLRQTKHSLNTSSRSFFPGRKQPSQRKIFYCRNHTMSSILPPPAMEPLPRAPGPLHVAWVSGKHPYLRP